MRNKYNIPIIGMEPAIKRAIDLYGDKQRVLVTATPITVNGKKIYNLINKLGKREIIDLLALPKLVEFAERQEFDSNDVTNYLHEQFSSYDLSQFSSIVLGCTHFNYFKDTMRKILPNNIKFVDGNGGTLNELMRRLNLSPSMKNSELKVDYYYSGHKINSTDELKRLEIYLNRLNEMYDII